MRARVYTEQRGIFKMTEIKNPYTELIDETADEKVNSPKHYKAGNFECIDIMVAVFGIKAVRIFCLLNSFKYIFRCNAKNKVEDIMKARWYLNWYLAHSDEESEIE